MIARFTRDEASKYVWGLLTMAAIGGLVFAMVHSGTVLAEDRKAAQARATGYVEHVLEPRLDGIDPSVPLTGQRATSLQGALEESVLSDTRVSRVRLWSTDGTLLFSTDRSDDPGSDAGLNDEVLRHVSRDGVLTSSDISDTGGAEDPERSLLRTYAPLEGEIVAEIDQTDEGTVAADRTAWRGYQLVAGVLIALLLVMTVLSLRDPIERINVGVPFALSSIPSGYSLIDDERLEAVHEVYRLASERVSKLQQKLEASEEARRRLEGDIQRSLSKAATTPTRVDAPVASPPRRTWFRSRSSRSPSPTVVVDRGEEARAPAFAGPLARASRAQKPLPRLHAKSSRSPRSRSDAETNEGETVKARPKPSVDERRDSTAEGAAGPRRCRPRRRTGLLPLPHRCARPRPHPHPHRRPRSPRNARTAPAPTVRPSPRRPTGGRACAEARGRRSPESGWTTRRRMRRHSKPSSD